MYVINVTYFRDRSAVIRCTDNPGIILRLLSQFPDEFFKIDLVSAFMFDYSDDKFRNMIEEYFNPDVIQFESQQFVNESINPSLI